MAIRSLKGEVLELSPEVRGLLDNGMDFLKKAQTEFATSPTHSIVSFWTAVELLLKVPLAHEHWSLVCSGKKIIRSKYLTGDFQSITFSETCDRLRDVLEKPLHTSTVSSFDIIRQHRNRVVHFYHDALNDQAKEKLLIEQADAWFALNRLMREDWKSLFEGALGHYLASQETQLLINNSYYADIKFQQVKKILEEHVSKGGRVIECHLCKKVAVPLKTTFEFEEYSFKSSSCLVCSTTQDGLVEFSCPACDENQILKAWEESDFECSKCQHTASRYELFDTSSFSPDEYCTLSVPAGCSECEQNDTVCEFGEKYLCTYCFGIFENVEQCEYCSYHSTSVDEFSGMTGCSFCDGHRETWPEDDD